MYPPPRRPCVSLLCFIPQRFGCWCGSGALSYFGEDPELTPQEFFTTLHSFIKVRSFVLFWRPARTGVPNTLVFAMNFFQTVLLIAVHRAVCVHVHVCIHHTRLSRFRVPACPGGWP